jgi:hypothetical protein
MTSVLSARVNRRDPHDAGHILDSCDRNGSRGEIPRPGPEKHALVVTALEAAGWVDDSNRTEVERYIDLLIWVAKRPEVLAGLQAARRRCCRPS